MPLPLSPDPGGPGLTEAMRQLATLPTRRDQEAWYRDRVFPWAADRVRLEASARPEVRLLIVPVGTQPYSPLLAALGTNARQVALLHTPGSASFADEVGESLAPTGIAVQLYNIGDGLSGASVCRAMEAAIVGAGDPWPLDIAVDVTSGQRPTTTALGSVAAVRGYRQVYVVGEPIPGAHGYFHGERVVELDDVASLLLPDQRAAAVALFESGAFEAAQKRLEQVVSETLAGWAPQLMLGVVNAHLDPTPTGEGPKPAEILDRLHELSRAFPESAACRHLAELDQGALKDRRSLGASLVQALREEGAWRA